MFFNLSLPSGTGLRRALRIAGQQAKTSFYNCLPAGIHPAIIRQADRELLLKASPSSTLVDRHFPLPYTPRYGRCQLSIYDIITNMLCVCQVKYLLFFYYQLFFFRISLTIASRGLRFMKITVSDRAIIRYRTIQILYVSIKTAVASR